MSNPSMSQIILRVTAAALTVSAAVILAMSKQTVVMFGIAFHARYDYSSAYKFLFIVDVIACVFSILSLVMACSLGQIGSTLVNKFVFYLHDLVMMVLMISGCAAGTAIGYVGMYGENEMAWFKLCDRVGKFCNRVMGSLVLSYLVFFCYFALVIMGTKFFYNKAK